jgi:ubiquinone/menaquinone biosynthesis C-methylase UbiE
VVVDFGCGAGFFTVPLAKVAGKTIAMDVSSEMLKRAASYATKSGVIVEFIKSNGTEIRLGDESVDLILVYHVFHEVEDRPRVLSEFLRIMKPAGRLVVVEKTRGSSIVSGRLGPPIIDEMGVAREIELAGFAYVETIPHGKDSIIISRKMASALRPPS